MKKLFVLLLVMSAAAAVASAKNVALVNEKPITQEELDRSVKRFLNRMGGRLSRNPQVDRFVLESLINEELRDQYIKTQGIKVTNVDLYEAVKERRRQVMDEYGKELEDWVMEQGYDRGSYREALRAELRLKKYNDQVATKDRLEKHLAKYRNHFNGEARLVLHIGIRASKDTRTREEAKQLVEEVRKQLEGGADFGQLAEEKSEGPGKENGGMLGYIKWDNPKLAPSFKRVVFALNKSQLSPPVPSSQGYHLFRVDDVKPGKEVRLSQVEAEVRRDFLEAHLTAVVAQARKEAQIEILL